MQLAPSLLVFLSFLLKITFFNVAAAHHDYYVLLTQIFKEAEMPEASLRAVQDLADGSRPSEADTTENIILTGEDLDKASKDDDFPSSNGTMPDELLKNFPMSDQILSHLLLSPVNVEYGLSKFNDIVNQFHGMASMVPSFAAGLDQFRLIFSLLKFTKERPQNRMPLWDEKWDLRPKTKLALLDALEQVKLAATPRTVIKALVEEVRKVADNKTAKSIKLRFLVVNGLLADSHDIDLYIDELDSDLAYTLAASTGTPKERERLLLEFAENQEMKVSHTEREYLREFANLQNNQPPMHAFPSLVSVNATECLADAHIPEQWSFWLHRDPSRYAKPAQTSRRTGPAWIPITFSSSDFINVPYFSPLSPIMLEGEEPETTDSSPRPGSDETVGTAVPTRSPDHIDELVDSFEEIGGDGSKNAAVTVLMPEGSHNSEKAEQVKEDDTVSKTRQDVGNNLSLGELDTQAASGAEIDSASGNIGDDSGKDN